ncbi:MAG: hypothetical protein PHC51_03940 [bacterium]|nr:hypothetical protein [bacterium]
MAISLPALLRGILALIGLTGWLTRKEFQKMSEEEASASAKGDGENHPREDTH